MYDFMYEKCPEGAGKSIEVGSSLVVSSSWEKGWMDNDC